MTRGWGDPPIRPFNPFYDRKYGECVHGNGMAVCPICRGDDKKLAELLKELEKKMPNVEYKQQAECPCKPEPDDVCMHGKKGVWGSSLPSDSGGVFVPPTQPYGYYTGYPDIDDFLDECLETMRSKGHDYRQGNDDDLLHNFRTVAESVGTPIEKVWFTYFYKHYSAMVTFIKEGGQKESEPIESRIKDQIVYLLLFYRMVQEKKASRQTLVLGEMPGKTFHDDKYCKDCKGQLPQFAGMHFGPICVCGREEPVFSNPVAEKGSSDPSDLVITGHANTPIATVEVNGANIALPVERMQELAGLQGFGVPIPTDVAERSAEIVKTLADRDVERISDTETMITGL